MMVIKTLYKKTVSLLVVLVAVPVFADTVEPLMPNTAAQNACVVENTGVYTGEFVMIPVYEDVVYACAPGYYLPANAEQCVICPENSYCVGGEYMYNETTDQGIVPCGDGLVAPSGMWDVAQCGRILHVGADIVYLRSVKKTTPSLNFDLDGNGAADWFGNMTTRDVPMNANTENKFKVQYNDITYSVYDDTLNIEQ